MRSQSISTRRAREAELHQDLAEPLARALLACHRFAQLFFGERLALDQDLAERWSLPDPRLLSARTTRSDAVASSFVP